MDDKSLQPHEGVSSAPSVSARACPAAAMLFASFWIWRNAVLRRLCRRQLDARQRGSGLVDLFTNRRREPAG
jgi:hypothetical protein